MQQSVINLDKAFQNFFHPKLEAGKPRFQSKHGKQSSYHCMSVAVGDDWVKIPECNPIRAKIHRAILGKVRSITIARTVTGKYYACLLAEDGLPETTQMSDLHGNTVIGVDVGLSHLAITSKGEKVANP